jgi:hypothetical protein
VGIVNTFNVEFKDIGSELRLELTNATEVTLKTVEILTVFLKDEVTPGGGPSQAHIRFEAVSAIQPGENVVLSHKTWINGTPAQAVDDQIARLTTVTGKDKPYVLDISWQDVKGRTRFQRIPVGH